MKHSISFLLLTLTGLVITTLFLPFTGCANRGVGPQGGPVDTIPPHITSMTVPNGARNVKTKQMEIGFNEYIQINGSTDNILVSPPQQRPPEIKAVGKRIEIAFQQDLIDSTTYTIDFGDQIVDNNEKNPFRNYAFSFSTGSQIDSLEVYGQLINAEDLNPVSGIVIGLHQDLSDSVFFQQPFTRIARTNEEGEFAIRNVKSGAYRMYALQDQSRDYLFQSGEALAFLPDTIRPYITYNIEQDTIFLPDSLDAAGRPVVDSISSVEYAYFEPSNILLKLFREDYQRLYFQRMLRKEQHLIQFIFGAPQPQAPVFHALRLDSDSLMTDSTWVDVMQHSMLQSSANRDTFSLWLADSVAIRMDSIRLAMTYTKTDSIFQPALQTDTLLCIYRAPKVNERTLKTMQLKREQRGLVLRSNASRMFRHFDTLYIASPTPIHHFCADSIHLHSKRDSVLTPVPFHLQKMDSVGLSLLVLTSWQPNQDYQLSLDSGAITDIYALTSKATEYSLHVRSTEEYANMTVFVQPYSEDIYIQILNAQDMPVRTEHALPNGTAFQNMEPGTYYMRIFMDENGDGRWTTGDFKTHRQPEPVYYFHKKMTLRANWVFEEHFDWQVIPLLQQKPAAIRKDAATRKK